MKISGIGVVGATSPVGRQVLAWLHQSDNRFLAFSRQPGDVDGVTLYSLETLRTASLDALIWAAPVWTLTDWLPLLRQIGIKRLVAISSTSALTKQSSDSPAERAISQRLRDAETEALGWAREHQVHLTVLRPTLIWGNGRDRNVSEIVTMIRRFGFFPIAGRGYGGRQPLHAMDLAHACVQALAQDDGQQCRTITGGETLPYRIMVSRLFEAMGRAPRVVSIPVWLFGPPLMLLRCLPRYRQWTLAMVRRMDRDLVFTSDPVIDQWGVHRRSFHPSAEDLPR